MPLSVDCYVYRRHSFAVEARQVGWVGFSLAYWPDRLCPTMTLKCFRSLRHRNCSVAGLVAT
jgi:hypothetical protein